MEDELDELELDELELEDELELDEIWLRVFFAGLTGAPKTGGAAKGEGK